MPKTYPDIEKRIIELLHVAPMRQVEIADRFPGELYIDVGHAVRSLAARGLIEREKAGATYIVRVKE